MKYKREAANLGCMCVVGLADPRALSREKGLILRGSLRILSGAENGETDCHKRYHEYY